MPLPKISDETKAALARVAGPARRPGSRSSSRAASSAPAASGSNTEVIGIVIALIVLLVTFGALVPALLPLITAAVGVGIARSGSDALRPHDPELDRADPGDDARPRGRDRLRALHRLPAPSAPRARPGPEEAAARAVATAGSAVVFAGITVFIALAGLTVVGLPFLSVMGLAAAGAVLIQVVIALTLLPALLGFAGKRAARASSSRLRRTTWAQAGRGS